MNSRIYLDHNATSPLRPEAEEIIARFSKESLGNPSSIHSTGRKVRRLIDDAREEVARFIGANPSEIVFTSGGTESNHLAWNAFAREGSRIVTTSVEHASLLAAAERAKTTGAQLIQISVFKDGGIHPSEMESALESNPDLISVQHANNETGVVFPIQQWRTTGRKHTDAVQSVGKLDVDVHNLGVDFLSLSGHKLGTPSGVGALYVRRGSPFETLWDGGAQEKGRRTGTENVLGILCFGAVCKHLREEGATERTRIERLRNNFEKELTDRIDGIRITGASQPRVPNTSHVMFDRLDGESLLIACDLEGIECSTGAACSSGSLRPSHVLLAMGFSPENAQGSLRFSLGWNTTESEISQAVETLPKLVAQVRNAGHNYAQKKTG
jgi:cysteine desulfurase